LNHNEQEALSASELQTKISELLRSNPDIAEAVRVIRSAHIMSALLYCWFCRNYVGIFI